MRKRNNWRFQRTRLTMTTYASENQLVSAPLMTTIHKK